MSVGFSNVKIGDRIKLTRKNGDEVKISINHISLSPNPYYVQDNAGADYFDSDWDTLEILEKPLPTKMGAMLHNGKKGSSYFVLNSSGKWLDDSGFRHSKEVIQGFVRDGWKVVFEGLEYDA